VNFYGSLIYFIGIDVLRSKSSIFVSG